MARWRINLARFLAIAADLLQFVLMPVFGEGGLSPVDDVLDIVLSGVMIGLVGWHWAFAPAFLAELVPGVDLVPTWTVAVFLATKKQRPAKEQVIDVLPERAAEEPEKAASPSPRSP